MFEEKESAQPSQSNARIAKNAVMLYIRMLFTMLIGLYTSRVVLATLGEVDYGIYGVVGGIVAMMGFLNASMSGATSRFLTYELGRGDKDRLVRTFSSAMIVHIGIALVVLVLAETVGLWFLCNKLVIPAERMTAAHWVYQLSIASAMLSITQVPYNSVIIAHEKMDVYAYVEILNSVLKLAIVFLLLIGKQDKLILYAVLYFAVSVLILGIYRIYCIRRFEESHIKWNWDKEILKPLLSYSGWNIYTEMAFAVRQQGVGFLLNMFFGVVYNAAQGIANVVQGIILAFSSNIVLAFRPQIITSYSTAEYERMNSLIRMAIKITMFMLSLVTIPLCINAEYILGLWLVEVPYGTVLMTRVLLLINLVNTVSHVLMCGIHASGRMRLYSILTGTLYLLSLVVMYIYLRLSYGYEFVYYILLFVGFVVLSIYLYILKHNVPQFDTYGVIIKTIMPIALIIVATYYCSSHNVLGEEGSIRFMLVSAAVSTVILALLFFVCVFDSHERNYITNFVRQRLLHRA